MTDYITIVVAVLLIPAGFLWRRAAVKKIGASTPTKKLKRRRRFAVALIALGGYLLLTSLISLLFGPPAAESADVEIAAPRVTVLGFDLSVTVVTTWYIMAALIVLALLLRFTVLRRLKDVPAGLQNVLELAVEAITKYTKSTAHGVGQVLASYLFTVVVFLIGCDLVEMFGLRTPAADITLTGALAILSFFIINICGIRVKGALGRVKSLASPTFIIFPIRIVTDIAVPVSLACRLFGNMLGGLVVMELLYAALGSYAIGFPSLAGLYFNVFHPLIQAFIFITLTLTFVNEATE